MNNPLRKLIAPALALAIICIIGVVGYEYFLGWSLIDALYMVIITFTTAGWRDIHQMTPQGRIFDLVLVLSGLGIAIFTLEQFIEILINGELITYRRRKKMERTIKDLQGHYIICGFGRVGHQVAHELKADKKSFVVIDSKPETAQELESQQIPHLIGDITSDEKLEEAGIRAAKGIIACADSDTSNVFVTLSARSLNPKLFIVARASQKETEEKLKKAGADKVISPYFIAGRRMASMAMMPVAVDFLDTVMHSEHLELNLGEFKIEEGSKIIEKTLGEAQIRQNSGAYILSIRKLMGNFVLQPVADTKVDQGDVLVAIGTPSQLMALEKMVK